MDWLADEFAAIATDLHSDPDVGQTVQSVLEHAQALTGTQSSGIMLHHGRDIDSASASTPEAEKADRLQLEYGQGPSVAAMADRSTVVVDDISTDRRWPQWSSMAATLGVQSVLSVPLRTNADLLGALNLYSPEAGAFAAADAQAAELYGQHACIAISSAKRTSSLRRAVDARHLIGQAQGVLMERHGLDADQAFAMLRRGAREQGISVSERARQVIDSRSLVDVG